jgi:hypothetical protein
MPDGLQEKEPRRFIAELGVVIPPVGRTPQSCRELPAFGLAPQESRQEKPE